MVGIYYSATQKLIEYQDSQFNSLYNSYMDKMNKLVQLNEEFEKLKQSYNYDLPKTETYVDSSSTKKTVKTSNSKKTKKVSKSSKNKKVKKSTKTSKKSTKSKTSSKGGKVTGKSGKSSNNKSSKKPPKDRHGKGKKGEAQVSKPKGQRKVSKKKLVNAWNSSNDYKSQLKKAQKMRKNNTKNVKKGQGSKFLKKAWKWLNQPTKMSG